ERARVVAQVALQAMRGAGLKETPALWSAALVRIVEAGDATLVPFAVATLRGLPSPKENVAELGAVLRKIARQSDCADELRVGALAGIPGGMTNVDSD